MVLQNKQLRGAILSNVIENNVEGGGYVSYEQLKIHVIQKRR